MHDQADALDVLATLKESEVPVALVHDEYGHFEGIVTPADISGGDHRRVPLRSRSGGRACAVQREDGSWLLAGYMPADEMRDHLGIDLPEDRDYETVAGYVLSHLHHLPATGETVDAQGWRFEVVDLDGRRIDKVLASRLPGAHRARADTAAQAMANPARPHRRHGGTCWKSPLGTAGSFKLARKLAKRGGGLDFDAIALPYGAASAGWRRVERSSGYEVKVPSRLAELNRSTASRP